MKKFLSFICALFMTLTVWGGTPTRTLEPSKVLDNIEMTIKSGVTCPVKQTPKHLRSISGLEIRKNLTPVTGMGIEGDWTINTSPSKTVFDHQLVGGMLTSNMMNLFAGYPGSPRPFEIETVVGIGWLHGYVVGPGDYNSWYTKYGLNLNFNLNDKFALSLKPAIVYDMKDGDHTRYNVDNAYLEAQLGLTYKFLTSNGTHGFKYSDLAYTQAEVDALNAEINELRNRAPIVQEVIVEKIVTNAVEVIPVELENVIGFEINSYDVLPTEMANLSNVATVLKANPDMKVLIKGFADKDTGTTEYNKELSEHRAQAVKDVLVGMGVTDGQLMTAGVGDAIQPYDTNNWNRVVTFEVQ